VNKHIKRKRFYNNNRKQIKSKLPKSNDDYGLPRNFSMEEEKNSFLLYYKGKPRTRFYFPITIEMIRKYASAYAKCIKEFKLKV